jgi:hypothetical protein
MLNIIHWRYHHPSLQHVRNPLILLVRAKVQARLTPKQDSMGVRRQLVDHAVDRAEGSRWTLQPHHA